MKTSWSIVGFQQEKYTKLERYGTFKESDLVFLLYNVGKGRILEAILVGGK